MEPAIPESKKRSIAAFLPVRMIDGEREMFLQKREPTRTVLPNVFTMFGGGMHEGEAPEEACLREVKEELDYVPENMRYFTRCEVADAVIYVFFEEVREDFESNITVLEGEYGKFIKRSELRNMHEIALFSRLAAIQVALYLEGNEIPT